MSIRRITAGVAGVALAATAFTGGPATAKTNTTTVTLDQGFVSTLKSNGVKVSALPPATLKKNKISIPAPPAKRVIMHAGGLKFDKGGSYVSMGQLAVNTKSGKTAAFVDSSDGDIGVVPVLVVKGGKNTIQKNGMWKNAKLMLSKSIPVEGTQTDPAAYIDTVLGLPAGSVKTGQVIGKVTIKVSV